MSLLPNPGQPFMPQNTVPYSQSKHFYVLDLLLFKDLNTLFYTLNTSAFVPNHISRLYTACFWRALTIE